MTKAQITSKIAELKFPNQPIKQSLEVRCIERCGYTKDELLKELQNLPGECINGQWIYTPSK
jgi:hypothetical protein